MRKLLIMFIIVVLCLSMSLTAFASVENEINPRNNNFMMVNCSLSISDSGLATVIIKYVGYNGITTGGKITTKIEKLVSGNWQTVNIGVQNNQWVDESTLVNFSTSHSVQLNSRGTYRAVVVFEISGSGGATDVIEKIKEKTY